MQHLALALLLPLLACGCSGASVEPDGEADAGGPRDTGGEPAADAAPEPPAKAEPSPSGEADAAMRDDYGLPPRTHVSFETARPVEVGGQPLLQDILDSGQVDFYRFDGEAGGFYQVLTDRHRFSPDLVIAVYDADRELVARNDLGQRWPGDGVDARLVVRLPQSGDYFVRVEDPWTPPSFFNSSFPLLYYHLEVTRLSEGTPGVAFGGRDGPTLARLQEDPELGYAYVTLLGELGASPDVFELEGRVEHALLGKVLASGPGGNGSTASGGAIRIIDPDARVLARIDRDLGQAGIAPPVAAGMHRIELLGAEALGSNPFYAMDVVLIPENPSEQNDAENGGVEGAEAIEMSEGAWRQGVVLLSLPADDVDYFRFEAAEGEQITVRCEGESGGSGVRALEAEVRDPSDRLLGRAVEQPAENLRIRDAMATETGTHYLRLSSDASLDDGKVEPWVRCGVTAGP